MIGIGLAKGEYEYPATDIRERGSKLISQLLFLSACFALLGEQRAEQLFSLGSSLTIPDKPWESLGELKSALDSIRDPVKAWCLEVGLNTDWCCKYALLDVLAVRMQDEPAYLDGLGPLIDRARVERALPERALVLDFGNWDVTEMTRQDFVRKAQQQFKQRLGEYVADKEKEAGTAGLLTVPERRNIDTYFWLAGYQVLHWPIEYIAEAENRERPYRWQADLHPSCGDRAQNARRKGL